MALTIWDRGIADGQVSDKPTAKFPIAVQGFTLGQGGHYHGPDDDTRPRVPTNEVRYVTRDFAEQLLARAFAAERYLEELARLDDGKFVETVSNRYWKVETK